VEKLVTKKTIALACLLLFVSGLFISWLLHLWAEKRQNSEICSASIVLYHNNVRANVTLDFIYSLETQTGVVSINGTYAQDDTVKGVIRRDVSYTWTENKDALHFYSVKVNKIFNDNSVSDEDLAEVLPDFYVYPEKSITYTVLPQGKNSFLFTVGKRPVFLCYR
jgi:hypothetical protein